jgi:hypothetical protein
LPLLAYRRLALPCPKSTSAKKKPRVWASGPFLDILPAKAWSEGRQINYQLL